MIKNEPIFGFGAKINRRVAATRPHSCSLRPRHRGRARAQWRRSQNSRGGLDEGHDLYGDDIERAFKADWDR